MTNDREPGPVIRRFRTQRGITLRAVAEATGLSESFLSQFERGMSAASVRSLRLITDALGVGFTELFHGGEDGSGRVIRADARATVPFGDDATKQIVTPRLLESIEVLQVEFAPGGSTGEEPFAHGPSDEVLIVQQGAMLVELGDERHLLEAGDSITFRSEVPHRVAHAAGDVARAYWIVTPAGH
ncbi:XRE family transcriptional regulator [Microbacterium sp. NPDC096154]|uniref:helix-turn-helix domain-containing protein n=1 Tax=Microbacterium sp. NPDC096154 TaxID=3155549 RepID=UPI00332971E2